MTRNANGTWTLTDDEMNSLSIYANEAADRYSLQCMDWRTPPGQQQAPFTSS